MFDGLGAPTPTYLKPKKSRTDPGMNKSIHVFELNLSYFLSRSQGTETECHAQRNTLLRQAIYVDPGIVEAAAARIQSYIVRQRLEAHPAAMWGYQKGGRVAAEINATVAKAFCQALLAPVAEVYEDEKRRLLRYPSAIRVGLGANCWVGLTRHRGVFFLESGLE